MPTFNLSKTYNMLQAKTKEQQEHINTLLEDMQIAYSEAKENGVLIDDFIEYNDMATIVDYLRMSDKKDELFEECWKTYRRKGIKRKSMEYWKKLTNKEKNVVLTHIKAYVSTRDIQYQKDFERYLRDKVFETIVYKGNSVVYDPTKKKSDGISDVYMPTCDGMLSWNDYYGCYMYVGFWDGRIADGYNDDDRPNGASVTLNNGRGTVVWDAQTKSWNKI